MGRDDVNGNALCVRRGATVLCRLGVLTPAYDGSYPLMIVFRFGSDTFSWCSPCNCPVTTVPVATDFRTARLTPVQLLGPKDTSAPGFPATLHQVHAKNGFDSDDNMVAMLRFFMGRWYTAVPTFSTCIWDAYDNTTCVQPSGTVGVNVGAEIRQLRLQQSKTNIHGALLVRSNGTTVPTISGTDNPGEPWKRGILFPAKEVAPVYPYLYVNVPFPLSNNFVSTVVAIVYNEIGPYPY